VHGTGRVLGALLFSMLFGGGTLVAEEIDFLLDDFSSDDRRSLIGTPWEGFTDQVMGGVSEMTSGVQESGDGPALRMHGAVSLENNGGFIQMRLDLANSGTFDGSSYTGFVLEARAVGDHYYLHARTPQTTAPWAHFAASLPVTEEWELVHVPFSAFEPQNARAASLDTGRLHSVAIVAGKQDFTADIWVRRIGLYR
jgi:hypothetical protein